MGEGLMINISFRQLDLLQQIQLLKETCRLFKQDKDPELIKQVLSMVEEIDLPELIPGFNTIEGVA
tara:strand:- start:1266 stop:1463 length:198 start_codon:yes stop_codon:yes gene_type:complete